MPVVDRREFGGRFTVRENSRRLANYRYLEIQLMEMIAGWCHTTPQISLKATFGYHVYDHAQAADQLGQRLEKLRSSSLRQEPATDEFARLCEKVWNLESIPERLTAVYRVLEPHLVSTYVYHADATDPLTDTPTVRLMRNLAGMGQSHIAWGQAVLESLTQNTEDRRRAMDLQAELEGDLVACGGVTGQGIESHWLVFHSTRAADKPPKKAKRGNTGYHFIKRCPPRDHSEVEAPFWFSGEPADFKKAYNSEDEWSLEGYRHKFHQLLYGEVETTDRMGKMLAEFPDLPWEMRLELANQMWDEARHIEIVAKATAEDLGAELGYGPWPLAWWWMQNESDPLRRIAVTNAWSEANLMHTLREWRINAEQHGYTRLAELCDYLQADELNHVKLATRWIRELTASDPLRREELVRWGVGAIRRIESFYGSAYGGGAPKPEEERPEPHFSFQRGEPEAAGHVTNIIGE